MGNKLARTKQFRLPNTDLQFIMRNDGVVQYRNADGRVYNAFYKAKDGRWFQIMSIEVYTSDMLEVLNQTYNQLASGDE
jgi:hypothetical protein